jgi:hypothetical protein
MGWKLCGIGSPGGDKMKRLPHSLAAIGVVVSLFTSSGSFAELPNSLDHLLWDTNLDFFNCSTVLETAEIISDTPGYGPNSPKTKDAYEKFYTYRDKAASNAEARFLAIKQELVSKVDAEAALRELYIYWRAEIGPCITHKKSDVVTSKFRLLLERVRVEASW